MAVTKSTKNAAANELTVPANDDFPVAVTHFPGGSKHLLISCAMAVGQNFYYPIARFFQDEGYSVTTYDYRGTGLSRRGSLRNFHANMGDWALRDLQGVMEWLEQEHVPEKLFLLGHSLGGKLSGLPRGVRVDGLASICTLSGYWRLQPKWEPYKVLFHTSVTFPVTCALFGYMPWSLFAKGCDLPRGAALQWAGWCRKPNYLFSDPTIPHHRLSEFDAPVLACSISDDAWGTPRAVEALMKVFPRVEFRHLTPEEFGLTKLGHFGYFRKESRAAWSFLRDWYEQL